jgi:hypothetical protein
MISYQGLMKFMAASTVFILWMTWIAAPVLIIIYLILKDIIKYTISFII